MSENLAVAPVVGKRVVSVSLGTSKRNKSYSINILGQDFFIERLGMDGDFKKFKSKLLELDGVVDAIGFGGVDIYVKIGEESYTFRQIKKLKDLVKVTPIADGSGVKHTLEREAINEIQKSGILDFANERVLLVSAVDRFGMAQALDKVCPHMIYGDLLFALGLPIRLTSYRSVERLGRITLPIITKLPFKWFYPTGEKQEKRTPKFPKIFAECTVIAGDWHYIHRYAPEQMEGKTIITQTVRTADLEWLKKAGVLRVITTTPLMGGETFATNVIEGILIALTGKKGSDVGEMEYINLLKKLDWKPNVIELQAPKVSETGSPFSLRWQA